MAGRGRRRLAAARCGATRSGAIFPRSSSPVPPCAVTPSSPSRSSPPVAPIPGPARPFDGAAALGYTKTQLDFGPRIPGSDGHRRTGDWLVARGARDGGHRDRAALLPRHGEGGHAPAAEHSLPLPPPRRAQRVLYVTHWDSRPVSDRPTIPERRSLADARRERRRRRRRRARRARRGAQAHAARRRRGPALRGRRGLRQLRATARTCCSARATSRRTSPTRRTVRSTACSGT